MPQLPNQLRQYLLPCIFVAGALMFNLGGYPLLDPDEGRNAEVAREMAESNRYLVPTLNGLPYVDKPVLHFAVTATALKLFGPTEWAARLPSLLFTLITLLVVGWFGHRLFDLQVGVTAALATGAAPLTIAFARTVIFDAALTLFVTIALAGFYLAVDRFDRTSPHAHARFAAIAWAAIALGVLTKGPIAIVLPFIVAGPYALWRRRGPALLDLVGVLLFVAVVLPWVLVMSDNAPGFLRYVIITETLGRFGTTELQRTGPWWYFLPILFAGALPWSIPVVGRFGAWVKDRTREAADPRLVFLALWIIVPLIFFSISQSKRVQYVLPIIPAFGLAAAYVWYRHGHRVIRRFTGLALFPIAAILLAAPVIVGRLLNLEGTVSEAIPATALGLGVVVAIASVGLVLWPARSLLGLALLTMPAAAIPVASVELMNAIGADRSSRELAIRIERTLPAGADVVGIQAYPLSLPFYLRRPLTLSSGDGRELTSNYLIRSYEDWVELDARLQPVDWWFEAVAECSRPTAFVVRRDHVAAREILERRLPLIYQDRKHAAYGPCLVTDLASAPAGPA